MKSKILKLSALCLISALIVVFSWEQIISCSGGDPEDIRDRSLFAPEIIRMEQFEPFFLTGEDYYYSQNDEERTIVEDINIVEWKAYFKDLLTYSQADSLVYKLSSDELTKLRKWCSGKSSDYKGGFKSLKENREVIPAIDYLLIAREMERKAEYHYYRWDSSGYDKKDLGQLIPVLKEGLKNASNQYLKLRYGFQLIRAYYFTGNYEDGITYFDNTFKSKADGGSIYFRSLGYKAGCLYKLKKYAESNLIYASLYDQYEPGRISALESFHPQEEADWKRTLELCKTNREKEILWQLFGIYADPLRGLTEINEIDPESDLLDLLLVRSVNIAEVEFLINPLYDNYNLNVYYLDGEDAPGIMGSSLHSWSSIDSTSVLQLLSFIEEKAISKQKNKSVWECAAAYLHWLGGNFVQSAAWIKKAEKYAGSDRLIKGQISILKAIQRAKTLSKVTPADELDLMTILKDLEQEKLPLRSSNAIRYIRTFLREKYEAQSDFLMAELSTPNSEQFYADRDNVKQMIVLYEQKTRRPFQDYLFSGYPIGLGQLYEILAVDKMYEYDFDGAQALFNRNASAGKSELSANPFNIRIKDCHDCDHESYRVSHKIDYTKGYFADKMIELKSKGQTEKDVDERANNYFLFANGLYNMTWYGNGRVIGVTVVDYAIASSVRFSDYSEEKRKFSSLFDCNEAQKYYLMAMELSTKKEFKAKCAWMAARCEHNDWLENHYGEDGTGDFLAGMYFKMMKEKFADTKYYKDVIAECGYFCTYLNPGDKKCIRTKE